MLRKIIYLFGLFTMFSGFISSGNAEEVNTYLSDGLIILADNHGGETAAPMVEEPVVAAEEVPTIDSGDDKATVVALREIAAGTVTQDNIQEFNFDIFEEELSEQLTSDSET